ncbi:MAG: thiamine-phosphate kinase [Bacteroidales bacterium]|nr:thiamine-phosphate kinase [Bacteroidales bacterium]
MEKGEFELIDWIKGQFMVPDGVLGIGDDCAVLPQRDGLETLVTTDMLVEGVHFLLEDVDPYSLGWKSAAVNLSDIAGMGGKPVGTFLSCALPKTLDDGFLKGFFEGYKALSDRFDCPLLGGDTTSSLNKLCINVTVLGECVAGRSRRRSAAEPGDLICVTGPLGDSAAGLRLVLESAGYPENTLPCGILRERHYRPVPRIEEGMKLAATPGVNAMMDISDGIGSDLRHILEESGTGARIDVRSLPLSAELRTVCARRGWDPVELALNGGEDYELLFTCRPGTEVPVQHTVIGEILATPGLHWEGTDRDFIGFHHF